MNSQFQLSTTIMLSIVLMIITVFGIYSALMHNGDTQTASDAVYTSLMRASDDDARNERGVFAISKSDFEYYMNHSTIRDWKAENKSHLAFSYYDDDSRNAKDFLATVPSSQKDDVKAIKAVKVRLINASGKTMDVVNYVVSTHVSNDGATGIDATDKSAVDKYHKTIPN